MLNSSENAFDAVNSFNSDSIFSVNPFSQNASDYSTTLNTDSYFQPDSMSPITEIEPTSETNPSPFESGFYTVGDNGKIGFDYLFDGGSYQGSLGIFNLTGLDEYEVGSEAFIEETARRALSNSQSGYVVISEQNETAKYTSLNPDSITGEYQGIKTFEMNRGEQFGLMLIPNGTLEEVLDNPGISGDKQPIFSMDAANSQTGSYIARVKNIADNGSIWAMEDSLSADNTNKDFNDFVFYLEGANGNAPSLDTLLNPDSEWLSEDVANQILEWQPSPTDSAGEAIKDGDLVKADGKIYLVESGKKRWISNPGIFQARGFNGDDIKTITDENLNEISSGDNFPIPSKYQQSPDTTKEWISDFYWWNGDGKPSDDFFKDSNNKFATLNLGSNSTDGDKGIKFDWGDGSILNDNNLLKDGFAVRSYTQANFEKGKKYKAKVRADDGYQLFAKNTTTDEWVYFTPENEWKTDAYGAHKEIELEVDESGVYDFHFHYFEGSGDAYFDLSWEEVNTYNYMPELASLTEQQWDKYSGDNTKFDNLGNDESPDSIKKIYEDVSQTIFGKYVPMSAGYAYDVSYRDGVVIENTTGWSHSGIDFDSYPGDEVKAAVNGKIAKIDYEDSSLGYAIAVDETDSNGKQVGRRWWYFHLNDAGNWQEGDSVEAGVSNFGILLPSQGHLHLTVQDDNFDQKGYFNSLSADTVTDRTMSPLQAFWLSRNNEVINPSPSLSYFTGKVDSETLNVRTSPSVKAIISSEPLQSGNDITFDAWANGGKYQLPNGEIKNEWYRIKGTSDWVAGAYIDSRPNNAILKLELANDDFEDALQFTLKREGGYVNDPDDSGGATNKGITQSTYNQYRTGLGLEISDVKSITDEEVSDIYFDSYWLASSSEELSEKLASAHFDASVNHGIGTSTQMLKEAQDSDGNETNQVTKYLDIREDYYYQLVEDNSKNEKFLEGWLNRVNALRDFLA